MDSTLTLSDIANGAFTKDAAEELNISSLLSIASNIKAIHVNTRRYSQHMALDEAFEDLNDSLDKFNECVQGYYIRKRGSRLKLSNPEIKFTIPQDNKVMDAIKKLEDDFTKAANKVDDKASPLLSLRDDVLNCFYQLYYRLDLN